MTLPEKRIVGFINEHHVLIQTTVNENDPWSADRFYTCLEDENCFVFTSDEDTKNAQDAHSNSKVAGSVVLQTNTVGKIQDGEMLRQGENLHKKAKKAYLKRFPYAALMKTSIWVQNLNHIKITDNRLVFGNKLIWKKEE